MYVLTWVIRYYTISLLFPGTCYKTDLSADYIAYWSTSMAQSEQSRIFFPLVALGSFLFAIGGEDAVGGNYLDSIARYDIINDVWDENFGNLTIGRSKHCAVVYSGEIWIIGGERFVLKY